jgi:hypothetical protein
MITKFGVKIWRGFNWLGSMTGHGNEISVSVKEGNFLTSGVTISFSRKAPHRAVVILKEVG